VEVIVKVADILDEARYSKPSAMKAERKALAGLV
jgi:hypothetical protein